MADNKTHKDYLEKAKELLNYEDTSARVEEVVKLSKNYHNHKTLNADLMKDFDFDGEKLGELEKKIRTEALKKGKEGLSDLEAEELLKDILEEVMIPMGYGNEHDRDTMYNQFDAYIRSMGKEGQKIHNNILNSIKNGEGDDAVFGVRQGLKSFHINNHRRTFYRTLVPQDHESFRDELSKYITNEGNKALKDSGELDSSQVKLNLDEMLMHYSTGNYEEMNKKAGKKADYTPSSE